ncbi:DNA-binding response regulator [Polaribacter reichenbachii]|uniref:response regulator transcription factor n=1 Tax=Polaribacter reichenbachii TaxID=996801 RepID=UPI0008381A5D|nr:response regulator transcription factor [Polaribacter reichenbachii]APZ47258.1 DNA-binding response regulator [Polaribacter reichenbachii]AUC17899.1 DNA-binding response regulator [Polaribacter reichenbachii]
MINLIITDDHDLFRFGLTELLKKHKDINVVNTFSDGQELLNCLEKKEDIDVVLLDISMPNLDGFQVLNKIKNLSTNAKPIIISMHNEGNYIAKCAKGGAYGYLIKNADEDELLMSIRTVAKGKKYFSVEISEKMVNFMSENKVSANQLSNKENQVLELISKGFTTKEIASQLFVSSRTIETHRANILKKLEVKNTAALIKKATEKNII